LNVASAGTGAGAQELRALLQRLVRAWDSASAQTIEAALGSLRDVLTQEQLAPLQTAVDGFDFRDGEASSRALARALGVSL
jgi:hypothetical protein